MPKPIKILALAVMAIMVAAGATAQTLNIGDKAPRIAVTKWVKGTPVKEFDPKKVYVVEFWATWCGPCKQSIPHLTELAKKYKDQVTFTGVSIWEKGRGSTETTDQIQKKVADFVDSMAEKMDYNVATDTADDSMSNTWMRAAGENGIPSAFVIKDSKIAWIGHPMSGLDEAITEILTGAFDEAEAKAARTKEKEAEKEQMEMSTNLSAAIKAKDYDKAMKVLDEAIAKHPESKEQFTEIKLNILSSGEKAKLEAFLDSVYADKSWSAEFLNTVAWDLCTEKVYDSIDKSYSTKFAKRALDTVDDGTLTQVMVLDTYAACLWKEGKKTEALKQQELAVSKASKLAEEVPEDMLKEMKDRLAEYKKG
ncbi:MAG: TlpA family protein disulfide reductase [Armatimonadetes bacterium]|nr:TlpA family protein disulfide reductase [Armatimonadota bacterium]